MLDQRPTCFNPRWLHLATNRTWRICNVLVPDNTGQIQGFFRVHVSAGRHCFGSMQRTNAALDLLFTPVSCQKVTVLLCMHIVIQRWLNPQCHGWQKESCDLTVWTKCDGINDRVSQNGKTTKKSWEEKGSMQMLTNLVQLLQSNSQNNDSYERNENVPRCVLTLLSQISY